MQPPLSQTEQESAELARFREEWKAEVRRRRDEAKAGLKASSSASTQVASASQGQAADLLPQATIPQVNPTISQQATVRTPSVVAHISSASAHLAPSKFSPGLSSALAVYRRAAELEQTGELDDALYLYRQAFRMDANVDRAYHREELLHASLKEVQKASQNGIKKLADDFSKSLSLASTTPTPATVTAGRTLAKVISEFPSSLDFQPEIDSQPVHLRKLPEELLLKVLRELDPTSLERFALVSRKSRVLTLDSTTWKIFVANTYKPPQISDLQQLEVLVKQYHSDFRQFYIMQPRVRLDGVYIATCHYVRPGLSENSWVNISHLITYHRYLRFFPNGQVLSLLANEEVMPQAVISLLKPTLRMKGLFIGTWRLSGTTIYLSNLVDASGRFPLPPAYDDAYHDKPPIPSQATSEGNRYIFTMTLSVQSRPLGRWNKLNIQSYESIRLDTRDATPVPLKHERPFWFSKVRSYAA